MINDILAEYSSLIEKRIDELFPKSDASYHKVIDAARYSLTLGGKRIRPILMMEFTKLCGGNIEDSLDMAIALEMIHTYSLIHDDLPCMDNDDMRRGKSSCHIQFGEDIALLAGDALLTEAFFLASNSNMPVNRKIKSISFLSSNAGVHGMIGGQVLDLLFEEKVPEIEELQDMYMRKTAALIIAAVSIGCIAAGKDDEQTLKSAAKYGYNLGLAFQVIDDILDCTSNQEILGKPIGSDKKNNKTTFISIYGLEKSFAIATQLTNQALDALDEFSGDTKRLYEITDYLLERNK